MPQQEKVCAFAKDGRIVDRKVPLANRMALSG